MATKTDIELKIVDSVDTSHTDAEVLADSASNPDAFYVGRGYLAHNGEKVIESIDENGTYPNVTVGNATKATTADTATRANTAATATTAVNISDAPVLTATEDEQITVKVGNKTSNPLTIPYAQRADFATDLSGRVEATPEMFTYRPSAGDKSIKDDNAFIRRVKGNSVVFNQILVPRSLTETSNGITVTQDGTGKVVVKGTATGRAQVSVGTAQIITGHKYVYWGLVGNGSNKFYWTDQTVSADTGKGVIAQPTYASGNRYFILNVLQGVTVDFTFYPQVSDLTAMFGTGNEPTTVEEFRALYPNTYYPYNAGELRNLVCSGIKTVGFNQWDEQWERGTLNSVGENDYTEKTIRSKNYTPAIGNADYYVGVTSEGYDNIYYLGISWYDGNKQFISKIYCNQRVVTSPVNAAYFRIFTNTNSYVYGPTYNNDICVNLHHTGYRDGEYEPYKEVTHTLPLNKITNGEPLRKAGSVYDEINETEYIKRVGVVDLGSLNWGYNSQNACFTTYDLAGNASAFNFFCSRYTVSNYGFADIPDKSIRSTSSALHSLGIKDSAFTTDAASFKASLSGVLLHYELAEPIVTPIETPIDFNYYVEDFGTEEAILAENSAPFSADIIYQFNATDQVRNNSRNIQRLQKSVFTPSGTTSQYIRGDGSYADVSELSRVIPINDGEGEGIDLEDGGQNLEFRLFPQYYAKSKHTADADMYQEVIIRVEAPDNTDFVAEYWFELEIGESIPPIRFENPDNEETLFRFNGDIQTYAVNIWHIITTDGGMRYFGEIKSYLIE